VIPIVTPAEMGEVDRAASEPVEVLVARAGRAVAAAAVELLRARRGRVAGARIVVVAGRGNNGADGRDAARRLAARGAGVTVVDPGAGLPAAHLVVDAAFGTGLSRAYEPPEVPPDVPVLAVDIPSGIDGVTGVVVEGGGAVRADRTVTFQAWKTGLLIGDGPGHAGAVDVADIGLGPGVADRARAWVVGDADVRGAVPDRPREAHKWQSAVQVVAGSPGMSGAPWMVSHAALRAGAGYVRLAIPGVAAGQAGLPPGELVQVGLPPERWSAEVIDGLGRFAAVVVGPGLGSPGRTGADTEVGRLVAGSEVPVVVDADGLNTLGSLDAVAAVVATRPARPVVLTPHAGEFARLTGEAPGADRLAAVRAAAARSGAVVLLKGSTTVVAHPDGRVLVSTAGSSRLATAGTGDVLSGVVGALLGRGVPALEAAALGAHVHGRASALGPSDGLVATDLPDLVSRWLSALRHPGGRRPA
jgi:hydroxyethylthiazole kinase-like uncharacterized protein yjeF